jgi:hypothetical protein
VSRAGQPAEGVGPVAAFLAHGCEQHHPYHQQRIQGGLERLLEIRRAPVRLPSLRHRIPERKALNLSSGQFSAADEPRAAAIAAAS